MNKLSNKLSSVTKRITNQPTNLGLTGVDGAASITKWAMITKYLGLALLAIAVVAIVTINAEGGVFLG